MSTEQKPAETKPVEETKPAEETKPVEEKKPEEPVIADAEDDEPPALETVDTAAEAAAAAAPAPEEAKETRSEKKAKKALQKLGLKPVPDCMRVTMKHGNHLFVIARPDVYRTPSSDVYVIMGAITVESLNEDFQNQLLGKKPADDVSAALGEEKKEEKPEEKAAAAAAPAEEEKVDETGLSAEDINTLMTQAKCTRAKAVAALRKAKGDLVSAMMEVDA